MVGTLIECLSGNKVIELSDNPMTHSSSPSDFWGVRWNALVHIVLKGAVYIPLRRNGFSKGLAGLATFASSGLLHEYVLTVIALKGVILEDDSAYTPKYGSHLAFFAWNGIVLMLEGLLHKHPIIQKMKRTLPAPIITAMVLMTVLPVGHWFTGEFDRADCREHSLTNLPLASFCALILYHFHLKDEYAETEFYNDFAVGMPLLVWTPLRYEV